MLFNLSCLRHYPSKKMGNEILCRDDFGPCFGKHSQLDVIKEPFNGLNNCISKANQPNFEIPIDEFGKNMLTN